MGQVHQAREDRAAIAAAYSFAVRSINPATVGTSSTPETAWPALQMSFQRLASGLSRSAALVRAACAAASRATGTRNGEQET